MASCCSKSKWKYCCTCKWVVRIYRDFRLKPWLLFLFLWSYVTSGAYFLAYQEGPLQKIEAFNRSIQLNESRNEFARNLTARILNTTKLLLYVDEERSLSVMNLMDEALADYEKYMGFHWKDPTEWTFLNSTLYALSMITTVGHSGLKPKSLYGQIFAFCYTLVGVPLLLATVGEFAKLLYFLMETCYNRCQPPEDGETSTHGRSMFSSENNYTYNMAKPPPPYCKLVLACGALVAWLLGTSALLWYCPSPSARTLFPTFWDAVFVVFLSFFTVEVPLERGTVPGEDWTYFPLAIVGAATVALVFVSLTARVLGVLARSSERPSFPDYTIPEGDLYPALPRDPSVTFHSVTHQRHLIKDLQSPHVDGPPAFRPAKHQSEVNSSGQTSLLPRSSSIIAPETVSSSRHVPSPRDSIQGSTLSYGIREDDRVWMAEAAHYSENTLARDIKAIIAELPSTEDVSHSSIA